MSAAPTMVVEPAIVNALAEELVLASKMLGALAFDLGEDEGVLRRHMTSLQTIDYVTQVQLVIAKLLPRLDRGADLVSEIALDSLQTRLAGAIGR